MHDFFAFAICSSNCFLVLASDHSIAIAHCVFGLISYLSLHCQISTLGVFVLYAVKLSPSAWNEHLEVLLR